MTRLRHCANLADVTEVRRLLSTAQVAKMLGKSTRTIHRMADSGELPYVEKLEGLTGAYVFDPSVIELIARQQRETS